jgi:hypothetical protein
MSVGNYLRKAAVDFSWYKPTGAGCVTHSNVTYFSQIKKVIYQQIRSQLNEIKPVRLEQNSSRHAAIFEENARVKADVSADIQEYFRPQVGTATHKIGQLRVLRDFGGYFQSSDPCGLQEEICAMITRDKIVPPMKDLVEGLSKPPTNL